MVCRLVGFIDPSKRLQYVVEKTSNLLSIIRLNVLLGGSHLQRKAESCHEASFPNVDTLLPKMQMSVFSACTTSVRKQECKSSKAEYQILRNSVQAPLESIAHWLGS